MTVMSAARSPGSASEAASLGILRAGRVGRAVERDGGTAMAIDTLVRAERSSSGA